MAGIPEGKGHFQADIEGIAEPFSRPWRSSTSALEHQQSLRRSMAPPTLLSPTHYRTKRRSRVSVCSDFKSQKRAIRASVAGFSLIELLIVVAIILIIAAIAIPNLLRSRMAANEASAVGSVRSLNTSEVTYSAIWGLGYAATLSNLASSAGVCTASSTQACLVDPVLGAGAKSGYTFAAVGNTPVGGANQGVEVNATPATVGTTGTRSFCSDQSGVIRYKTTGTVVGTSIGSCAAVTTILQ